MARVAVSNRIKVDNMPQVLTFSGSQRVTLGTMGDLGSAMMGAFSFGLWLKTSAKITTIQYYLGTSNASGGNYLLCGITRNSSNVGFANFQIRDNSGHTLGVQVSTRKVNDGQWHHLVCTKDASNQVSGIKMYIDGVSEPLTTISNTLLTDCLDFTRNLAIGSGLGSGAVTLGWVGKLSRPYFYKRELTQIEVTDWYCQHVVPSTPFAGYENTEGTGTLVADVNGNYNGTLTAASQWESTDVPYKSRVTRSL
jgi:hypothetical protein